MAPIYKDECAFTFDNQFSSHGVDVCLTCFIGTTPNPAHDFTAQHYRIEGHSAYLNIKKVSKSVDESNSNQPQSSEHQPKRLHVKADDGTDKFTETYSFKTLAQDTEAAFEVQIKRVKEVDSYAKVQQAEEWNLELEVCEHVAMFESVFDDNNLELTKKTSEQLSHCSNCELDKNLWLCLYCGELGCGRRQFDGSGGNGHALEHFERHGDQHALAVKLGSITPEGLVDIYCYACNEDRLDPEVARHLARWGIDIAKQTKTEKSMTELQIEQNENLDFTSSDGGTIVSGPGLTGMKNLGNSCYMNSVIQSLFNFPEFASQFPANDSKSDAPLGGPNDLVTQLRKIQDGLDSGRYDMITPRMLKGVVGEDHAEFATARQQDAFEYLIHLLDKVSKVKKGLISELFGFMTERRMECQSCKGVRYIEETQENLSVSVPMEENEDGSFRAVPFDVLLDVYTAEESIDIICPRCHKQGAKTTLRFKTFPRVLIVNVRRFRIVNWVPQKVDVPVILNSASVTLDNYASMGPQPSEDIIDSDEVAADDKYEPEESSVAFLTSMGFDNDTIIAALHLAHKRGMETTDLEPIIDLIVSGEVLEDASRSPAKITGSNDVDTEKLIMLESMGFPSEQGRSALVATNGDVEGAVEWLFAGKYEETAHKIDLSAEVEGETSCPRVVGDDSKPANYVLGSMVCHKGASVHVGHYIAAVKKNDVMYLFNDERVTKGGDVDELQKYAYIYMLHRIPN